MSGIILIFVILRCTWFLTMYQMTPHPLETFFWFLDSITSSNIIHILKIFMGVVSRAYTFAQNWKYR